MACLLGAFCTAVFGCGPMLRVVCYRRTFEGRCSAHMWHENVLGPPIFYVE